MNLLEVVQEVNLYLIGAVDVNLYLFEAVHEDADSSNSERNSFEITRKVTNKTVYIDL